jgi:hypothetical protein
MENARYNEIEAQIAALRAAVNAVVTPTALAFGWADNTGDVVRGINDAYIASVTVTPTSSGKFLVIGSATLQYTAIVGPAGAVESFVLKIGSGPGPTIDYTAPTPVQIFVPQSTVGGTPENSASSTIQFAYTVAFVVGVPIEIGLVLEGGNGDVTCFAHSGQVSVMELPK